MSPETQQLIDDLRKTAMELRTQNPIVQQQTLVKSAQVITAMRGLQELRKILTGGVR